MLGEGWGGAICHLLECMRWARVCVRGPLLNRRSATSLTAWRWVIRARHSWGKGGQGRGERGEGGTRRACRWVIKVRHRG